MLSSGERRVIGFRVLGEERMGVVYGRSFGKTGIGLDRRSNSKLAMVGGSVTGLVLQPKTYPRIRLNNSSLIVFFQLKWQQRCDAITISPYLIASLRSLTS